jgi:predicted MFS family arabinose efflux permease
LGVKSLLSSRWSLTVLLTTLLEGAIVFGILALVPTMLHLRFGTALSSAGLSVALFGLGGLLYTRLARYLLATLGQPKLAAMGSFCMAIAFGTLALMPAASWSGPACLVAGLGFYMLHNTLQTCATQLNQTSRGAAVSLFVFVFFLGQSAGISLLSTAAGLNATYNPQGLAAFLILCVGSVFSLRLKAHLLK